MILSHKNKFIFFKTKKTGSTSLEIALSKICGKHDIITPVSELTWLGNIRYFEKNNEEDLRKKIRARSPQNFKGSFYFELVYFLKQFFHFYYNLFLTAIIKPKNIKYLKKKRRFKYDQHMEIREIKKFVNNKIYKNYYKFAVVRNPYDQAISDYYDQQKRPENFKHKNFNEYLKNRSKYFFYKNERKIAIEKKIEIDGYIKYENLQKDLVKILKKLNIPYAQIIRDINKTRAHGDLREKKLNVKNLTTKQKKYIRKSAYFFIKNFYYNI